MELASFLAGERWSDHPRCTHPLVASVARMVNDSTSDDARQDLARLIPDVIGTASDDPSVQARIARRAALTALPVAAAERQRVLAVGIMACERVLAELDGRPDGHVTAEAFAALSDVPDAHRWARRFSSGQDVSPRHFRDVAAVGIVRVAAMAVANACVGDRDRALRELLENVIGEARRTDERAGCDRLERDLVSSR